MKLSLILLFAPAMSLKGLKGGKCCKDTSGDDAGMCFIARFFDICGGEAVEVDSCRCSSANKWIDIIDEWDDFLIMDYYSRRFDCDSKECDCEANPEIDGCSGKESEAEDPNALY